MDYDQLLFRVHAIQRMFERKISVEDVKHVLDVEDHHYGLRTSA